MTAIEPIQLELPTAWTACASPTAASPHHHPPEPQLSHTPLILSIFPGIDLFGSAFEREGYCVVRGPDLIFGGDIRTFSPPPQVFDGVIGGPPCPDFSRARRTAPTGNGLAMLAEYSRVVTASQPTWALMENVPAVPNLDIPGYIRQRIDIRGTEVGITQRRIRHFQFFSRDGRPLAVRRQDTHAPTQPAATASEGRRQHRRTWPEFCALQGVDTAPDLDGMTIVARYRAIGNGVPIPMGRLLARSITAWSVTHTTSPLCICGCGREVKGKQMSATQACRKRIQRRRHSHTTDGKGVPCQSKDPQLQF